MTGSRGCFRVWQFFKLERVVILKEDDLNIEDMNRRITVLKGAIIVGIFAGMVIILLSYGASLLDLGFWQAMVLLIALAVLSS
jgi:hypothetical protein